MKRRQVGLTAAELRAMNLTVELTNLVCQSVIADGSGRGGDVNEFVGMIHAIQHIIMAQAAARAHPDLFRLLGTAGEWATP